MDLKDAQLGDRYRIFVNDSQELSDRPTMWTMIATIIAKKNPPHAPGFILGWKSNTEHPVGAVVRGSTGSEYNYVADQATYSFGKAALPSLSVAIKLVNGIDGMPCHRCANFYIYAVPNQMDGTLICWSCRNTW